MSIPSCPKHLVPLRAGNKSGYFCSKQDPEGAKGYCNCRANGAGVITSPPAGMPSAPVMPNPSNRVPVRPAPSLAAEPQTTSGHLILLGALDAAAKVYTGTGNDAAFLALVNEIILIHGDAK